MLRGPAVDVRQLVDPDEGWLSREVYWDGAVYEAELARIFARCWLFIAHESQLPNPGDFLTTRMGEDGIIVTRRRDGALAAYLNSCPHRGNKLCHAEAGNARGFVCNYHGWSFGLDGRLLGMWQQQAFERSEGYDAERLGLVPVAGIDTYKGLVFATFDPEAPPLADYLGDFRWYLDVLLDNDDGGTEFLPGCIRSLLHCNWKVAAENFAGDAVHAGWTHDSGARAMLGKGLKGDIDPSGSYSVNVNGHCWEFALDMVGNAATFGDRTVARYVRDRSDEVAARLGKIRSRMVGAASSVNVFPNFSFLPGQNSFRVWFPRGPLETELHTWVLVNRNHPPEIKEAYRRGAMLTFSPAGLFEMDDGENWEQTTLVNAGILTRQQRLWFGLGKGTRVDHPELPGNVFEGQINDANQRAFDRRWAQLLCAETWADAQVDPGADAR